MPIKPVIRPPTRKEINLGRRWAKSLAGPTTLAAMLVASVAMQSETMATISVTGLSNRVSSCTGSQIGAP